MPRPTRARRRVATVSAAALLVGLPLAAFVFAPAARADSSGTGSSGVPGGNLGGFSTSSSASAVQVLPYLPGVVGAGDTTTGNFVQVSVPYASSSMSTGPSMTAQSSPVWPGPTAAAAGTAISTLSSQFPAALVPYLNDHVQAEADYPSQPGVPSSSSYTPPTGSQAGAGTASAQAAGGGTSSSAATNDTTVASALELASSDSSTTSTLAASSVSTQAKTDVGKISLLGGEVVIDGISSQATATSNGSTAQQSSTLAVGQATVAGLGASIGPDGITLDKTTGLGSVLVTTANQVLQALQQAGISITTIAPTDSVQGGSASVTSGAVQIVFQDAHIPNPGGHLPIGSSVGLEVDLGISQASSDATGLPPLPPFPGLPSTSSNTVPAAVTPSVSTGSGTYTPGTPARTYTVTSGGSSPSSGTESAAPSLANTSSSGTPTYTRSSPSVQQITPIGFAGLPVHTAWVVIAVLLSIVAAGPLLAYANWQLLRGRGS